MGEYAEMLLEGYACAECGECFLDNRIINLCRVAIAKATGQTPQVR